MDRYIDGFGNFGPEEIEALGKLFEALVIKLKISTEPDRETLASRILELANSGTRDPVEIEQRIQWP